MEMIINQEWLDWAKLINGKILVWYFDFNECVIKTVII